MVELLVDDGDGSWTNVLTAPDSTLKRRWSYFIRRIYETDPLVCPKCSGEMHIISFIDQHAVIKKILQHLGLWEESQAPPARDPPIKEIVFDFSEENRGIAS